MDSKQNTSPDKRGSSKTLVRYDFNTYNPLSEKLFLEFFERYLKTFAFSKMKDDFRLPNYNKYGGIDQTDSSATSKMRSVGWELIKQIGKKIISGDFNLTTVSFPIKVMIPKTILQNIALSVFQFPVYFNIAGLQKDVIERFKFVIVASLSCFHQSSNFWKPLNPILGETYECDWQDGSRIYFEQTAHHPPISHYLMYGPNKLYMFHGYSNYSSSAGFNSVRVDNKGKRTVVFGDGQTITWNFCYEQYCNTFFGTPKHESLGDIIYTDSANGLSCELKISNVKKKASDYFQTTIKQYGKDICKVYGSYLSFIEFNDVRYWDVRENIPIKLLPIKPALLPSSSDYREDRSYLEQLDYDNAQKWKETLEDLQRSDKKLREKYGANSNNHSPTKKK